MCQLRWCNTPRQGGHGDHSSRIHDKEILFWVKNVLWLRILKHKLSAFSLKPWFIMCPTMQLPSILVIGLLVLMAVEFVSFLGQMQAFLFHLSLGTPAIQMKNQYYVNQS